MRPKYARMLALGVAAVIAVGAAPVAADAADGAHRCADTADPGRAEPVRGERFMVAAAHPLAVEAGCEVLRRGGSAADAAVAVQAVLTVVEPESSGFGGGSLITYWDARTRRTEFLDGLAQAPAEVTADLHTPTERERREHGVDRFDDSVDYTGRAVGVPGTVRVLDLLHDRHGTTPWPALFTDARRAALDGFAISPYLHDALREGCAYPDIRARYCDGTSPKPVGARVTNRDAAGVLGEVAAGGADAFYDPHGTIAPAIVRRAAAGPFQPRPDEHGPAVVPSLLTVRDFADYRARERPPLCGEVVEHRVCTAPPPASGGLTLLNTLSLAERHGITDHKPNSPDYAHLAIEASRLSGVDSRAHVGDPAFTHVPVAALRDPAYLDGRAARISPDSAVHPVRPGLAPGRDAGDGHDTTSQVSIVDGRGNALSMTTTVNLWFGSRLEARGIVLNNAQTNFGTPGSPNRVEPSKRPATSMAPTLAFDPSGTPRLVTGSAGGGPIPDYVAQSLLGVLSYGMNPQDALNAPHLSGQRRKADCGGEPDVASDVERGTTAESLLPALTARHHPCPAATELRSGATAVERTEDGTFLGAADDRRDGVAMGF
ncbi:gamma-glutamyltransferase family protein [Saccharopolyspora rosea]|uniref:Gamma-glutamyltransferase family protein n=1 Tax=Saccharopolyspora rosea TaxID=524884 RepID=A0ABW3G043_9PSEU|nr:gamma-glutamyltransferase [Saccharopolyspora rosea]